MIQPRTATRSLLRDLAENAAEARDVDTFRHQTLHRLVQATGADAGSFCTMSEEHFAGALVGTDVPIALVGRYAREVTLDEVRRTLVPTQEDTDVLSATRRNRLSMYREFLPDLGITRYAIRGWRVDARRYCWLTLARTGIHDRRRFISRTASIVDAVFPILILGERAHSSSKVRAPETFAMLTASEAKVVLLLERGLTNREIASVLGLSPNTVRNRIASAFTRVGATRRAELVYLLRGERAT